MKGDDLEVALDQIASDRAQARSDGVKHLTRILDQGRKTSILQRAESISDSLDDRGFHEIFESLFRFVKKEKAIYSQTTKPTSKNASSSKLSAAASALRMATEIGVSKIRLKSVNAVIDHVLDCLPNTTGEIYCPPLSLEYLKCLRSVLQYQPHLEHLRGAKINELVEFYLSGLKDVLQDHGESLTSLQQVSGNGSMLSSMQSSRNVRSTPLRISQRLDTQKSWSESTTITDELVLSIEALSVTSSSEFFARSEEIFSCLSSFLSSTSLSTQAQQAAFRAINNVLNVVVSENTLLAREIVDACLPIIARQWHIKSQFKDEMLLTLLLGLDILEVVPPLQLKDDRLQAIENIVESFQIEHCRRKEKDWLQIDDLIFFDTDKAPKMAFDGFGPRYNSNRSISRWVFTSISAALIAILDSARSVEAREDRMPYEEISDKRRRVARPIDDVLRNAVTLQGSERLHALQMVPHLLSHAPQTHGLFLDCLDRFVGGTREDNSSISSWSMIAIACFAHRQNASNRSRVESWSQVWRAAAQNVSIPACSRAACFLLSTLLRSELLTQSDAIDLTNKTVLSGGISSLPPSLTDSSMALHQAIGQLHLQASHDVESRAVALAIQWINATWAPGSMSDRIQSRHLAAHADPAALLNVLSVLSARESCFSTIPQVSYESKLFRDWLGLKNGRELTNYLLLKHNEKRASTPSTVQPPKILVDEKKRNRVDFLILEVILSKLKQAAEAWEELRDERTSSPNAVTVQVVVCLCTVARTFVTAWSPSLPSLCSDIMKASSGLWHKVNDYITQADPEVAFTYTVRVVSSIAVRMTLQLPNNSLTHAIRAMVTTTHDSINRSQSKETPNDSFEDASQTDLVELEESFASQSSQVGRNKTVTGMVRQHITSSFDLCFSVSSVLSELFVSHSFIGLDENEMPDRATQTITFLTSLPAYEFLETRNALLRFLPNAELNRSDACRLLTFIGEELVQPYVFARCESAICLCVEILTLLTPLWIHDMDDDLSEKALSLYQWFTEEVLGMGFASPRLLQCIVLLLQRVMAIDPSFSSRPSGPSPRTCLFQMLGHHSNVVKYQAGRTIPEFFGQFILGEHNAMFLDIIQSLPSDSSNIEGLALRLDVLARLGQQWHTIRQAAFNHIVETSATEAQAVPYAQCCLRRVAEKLNLEGLHELFRLFAPPLLNSLLDHGTLTAIPYTIFNYTSLKETFADVIDELVAQIAMRGSEALLQTLSEIMQTSSQELISSAFPKVEAYCLARDICQPPSQELKGKSTETIMRKHLGSEVADSLTRRHFAEIVSGLILLMDQEQQVNKAFSKRTQYANARTILNAIDRLDSPESYMRSSSHPSFRAKYILDELDFLCKRTAIDVSSLWSPNMTVFVLRKLMDSLHPALGPFHACGILRKIKIVVALSGSTVLGGYQLEQLLHAVRPFVTDFHTSSDAIGLFKYLLTEGTNHLEQNPSFLSGLIISVTMALKTFLASRQDSTTQESLFKEIVSSADAFRHWFVQYLDKRIPKVTPHSRTSFERIVRAASNFQTRGSTIKGTYEGSLLKTLLDDQGSSSPLLIQPTFDTAIGNLCRSFIRTERFQDDIASDDSSALRYAPVLWHVVSRTKIEGGFRLWAAHVLGKAYASNGQISDFLVEEHSHSLFVSDHSDNANYLPSNITIVRKILTLLSSEEQVIVGIAERTLQMIVGQVSGGGDYEPYANILGIPLLTAMTWNHLQVPEIRHRHPDTLLVDGLSCWDSELDVTHWASRFALNLAIRSAQDPTVGGLISILYELPDMATELLPYLVHSVLSVGQSSSADLTPFISQTFRDALRERPKTCRSHLRLIIGAVLYLRKQPYPQEATIVDREKWIELDISDLAATAAMCRMYKSALMILEFQTPQTTRSSRRSSLPKAILPSELLQEIFENLEDPDYFYGVPQSASISSIMKRLEYEGLGVKALSFQSAQFDSDLKMRFDPDSTPESSGLIGSLASAAFDGIACNLFRSPSSKPDASAVPRAAIAQAHLNLHEWDIPSTFAASSSGTLFKALASINKIRDDSMVSQILDESLDEIFENISQKNTFGRALHVAMGSLAALSELKDVWTCRGKEELEDLMKNLESRNDRTHIESFDPISRILTAREAVFSSFKTQPHLQDRMRISRQDAHFFEVTAVRETLRMSRKLEAAQPALNSAIYLSRMVAPAANVGLDIQAVASFDLAKVLWDQGEKSTSVQMLQELSQYRDLTKQVIPVSRAQLLADLGHQASEARLEDPQETIDRYLLPAIKELKGSSEGTVPGRVYHEFASYCDRRLQNSDDLEDFSRIEKLRSRKEQELNELELMIQEADGKQREALKFHLNKAKPWFKLDDQEYQRLKRIRDSLINQSLENYLLTLKACDDYDNDVLRFCALWLDQSFSETANAVVNKRISQIASRKFVPLMNQLTSRLLSTKDSFQALLSHLITRICRDHPFHGMYQIFATSKARHGREDAAVSRHSAANKIADNLHKDSKTGSLWVAIHNASSSFIKFANERVEEKKQGRFPIRSLSSGQRMEAETLQVTTRLPPPTLKIELREDCDYSCVPRIAKYDANFSIASGVSAPKIVTLVGSDGKRYKQLFKGGNDDLRQDAIMEQVFEQVSNLLRDHRETRRRKLGIRTYKVLPLHTNAGIIEFVSNTIPLHDYLLPAHQRYHPKDMKPNACRKAIAEVDKRPTDQRVQTFRKVTEKFNPVMRYFFFERFPNPDEWFVKRLAYSRTTAAISILGHVLGLGDRHGHNILLDETTGEVVHIDLGVAFEAGRVLPVPEVVPFRLTRDLVDGMGITKTEGVFRRCCNFTLEALRKESYSIMTVLDVLRYDPLYSWSLSPLRIRRMQETENAAEEEAKTTRGVSNTAGLGAKKRDVNEPSEADRALTVVAKKLGKSLSVEATVNELIQQATDERNLALLYCGWAAYA